MRNLASIQTITNLQPIEGADKIECATVLGWECVVKKDEFSIGQSVVYIEVDSLLPPIECFDFMQPRHYKVKTAKFKKQISQGLVMPITILPPGNYKEGQDVTSILQITKHDPQGDKEKRLQEQLDAVNKNRVDKFFKRYKWYRNFFKKIPKGFPHFIKKTDEERCLSGDCLVLTTEGEITIKDICTKDRNFQVYSVNKDSGIVEISEVIGKSVLNNSNRWLKVTFTSGKELILTENHRIWCDNSKDYIMAKDLMIGSQTLGVLS